MKKTMVKKATAKTSLTKAQDGKIIKSKKVRKVDLNSSGPSSASVSKTNRKGTTVTKSVDTSQGFVPYASQTKTVTNAQGDTTSKTKDIGWNKALKKQNRIAKKVGRNANDEWSISYKKGGATKAKKVAKPMMKAGGSTAGKTTPLYSNDPRTQQGRTLKKGGATSKTVSSRMKKGGTVKRKK